jgi:RES domain
LDDQNPARHYHRQACGGRSLSNYVPFDRSVFDDIDANLRSLEIDQIKQRLDPLMIGYSIECPIFEPGAFLYRARKIGPNFNKAIGITRKDLIYPPRHLAPLGRLNRAGQPVFYSSMHKESVFFELPELKAGDELILTFWKTTQKMVVNNIGYTEFAFKQLGAKRAVPQWGRPEVPGSTEQTVGLSTIPEEAVKIALSRDQSRELKEAFSEYFMRKVGADESFRYNLTAAIGEMHVGSVVSHNTQFAGILYPSVRMWANGDNLALLPWFADRHLEFRKAVHVRIKGSTETTIDINFEDAAHEFEVSGQLNWLGRIKNWTLQPKQKGKFLFAAGLDADGDYTISQDGTPAHWEAVDIVTGKQIEPH